MAELATGPYEVDIEHVTLKGDDGTAIDAIHARPDGMPKSGIVLQPDVWGVRPLFEDLCRRLATHGYAVCLPDPFVRETPEVQASTDSMLRTTAFPGLDDELLMGDLSRAADYLVVHDDVRDVAVMGFCMGGMQALKAAGTDRFDKAVVFYGVLRPPENWIGPRTCLPLDTAADVCPTLAIFAGHDPVISPDDVDALRAAWAGRTDCEIVVYPDAEHGFVHAPERPSHRAADAADAWRRVLEFLDRDR